MSSIDAVACAEVRASRHAAASADIAPPRTAATRVRYLDALRLFAMFQMLQGHTLAALLAPTYRNGVGYEVWSRVRGLTAACFLFAAGMTFYVSTARAFASHRHDPRAVGKRMRRGLFLVALGYALHAPLLRWLWSAGTLPAGAWRELIAVDVLQCIGVSLLLLEVSVLLAPSLRSWFLFVGVMWGLGLFGVMWTASVAPAYAVLGAYVSPQFGSQFPLLPWSAHLFAGVLCAALVGQTPRRAPLQLAAAALAMFAGSLALKLSCAPAIAIDHLVRSASVCALAAVLALACRPEQRWPRALERLAGQSLVVYVFHVMIVYGADIGLASRVGARLDPVAAACVAVVVVAMSCGAVAAWLRLRARVPARVRWLAGETGTR